ncbi:aspartate--tRNA ligase [candidate division WOR-3 bacterium]|nr:aspartate--tRNA ligase [candidate division WOR-3 bacterium]
MCSYQSHVSLCFKKRTHTCGELRKSHIGRRVTLLGWISSLRDHGGIFFINLRDRYGVTQVVVDKRELIDRVKRWRSEFIIEVTGEVRERPPDAINPNMATGEIEVLADDVHLLAEAKVPPFVIADDVKVRPELRLRYRYLDLRRPAVQRNIILRATVVREIRRYLDEHGFIEIETPILAKSTPEGARDFLVPSRNFPGKFYALAQSPQLYKQLLMVAGFDRYYQLAKCLRDEDPRKDRQPEFTQVDLEMSFVTEEDVFELVEGLMSHLWKTVLGVELESPFVRMTYREAMERFGTDKPDMRFGYELRDVTPIAKASDFRIFKQADKVVALLWQDELSRKEIEELETIAKEAGVGGLAFMRVKDGTIAGGVSKYFSEELQKGLLKLLDVRGDGTILMTAGDWKPTLEAMGAVRSKLIERLDPPNEYKFVWVTDFPIVEKTDTGYEPVHHIFSMPKRLDFEHPENMVGHVYDLVLNGVELGSGSIRAHKREIQEKLLEIIGLTKQQMEERFGFLLEALEYGAPPHGGIALGLERLVGEMVGDRHIPNFIAFPKTTTGLGLMEGIPGEVTPEQLQELHIKIEKPKQ